MTPTHVSRLTAALRSAQGRAGVGRALVTGLLEFSSADAVVAWLPESNSETPRSDDLFVAGAWATLDDRLLTVISGAGFRTWCTRQGFRRCISTSCLPQGGRIGVVWRATGPADPVLTSQLELLAALTSALFRLESVSQEAASAHSALVEAEEQLARSQRHRANAELASGLVHDFNNCLTTILGLTELAVEGLPSTDPTFEGLITVRTVALDAAVLVRRLSAIGRRANNDNHFELVDVQDVARSMREITRPRWSRRAELDGVRFEVVLELSDAPPIHVEAAEIRELLLNLLFNAFDAMPSGGRVTIATSTGADDGWAEVTVSDEGTGMSKDVLSHVFEPFFSTKGERGSGLGLSVCRNIAQRYGGTLNVESTPGVATLFTLRLPAAPADVVSVAEETSAAMSAAGYGAVIHPVAASDTSQRRILLVDDQEDVRQSVGEMLRALGHDVVTANDGPAALTTAMHDLPDVVITDFGMPGMNGAEVATRLQSVVPNVPVVMISGWGIDADTPLPGNVTLALGKPLTMKALGDAIVACHGWHPA